MHPIGRNFKQFLFLLFVGSLPPLAGSNATNNCPLDARDELIGGAIYHPFCSNLWIQKNLFWFAISEPESDRIDGVWGQTYFCTPGELDLYFLSDWEECDRSECFPCDYEPNGFLLHSKSKGKCQHDRNPQSSVWTLNLFLWLNEKKIVRQISEDFSAVEFFFLASEDDGKSYVPRNRFWTLVNCTKFGL